MPVRDSPASGPQRRHRPSTPSSAPPRHAAANPCEGRDAVVPQSSQLHVVVMPAGGGTPQLMVSSTALGGPAESVLWPNASTMLVSVGPLDLDPLGSRAQYRTVKIVAVAIPSGQVRLILANDSTHHFHREDFVYRGKRLYFTLAAWESDVGVMELTKRQ